MAQVTVAPAGYTGEADYYCDGTNDDILINAAIIYVSTAWAGGTVKLLDGVYSTSNSISIESSSVFIEGSGSGTIIYPTNIHAISCGNTSLVSNIKISNLSINASSQNPYGYAAIRFHQVVGGVVDSVRITSFHLGIYFTTSCSDCSIVNCYLDGLLDDKSGGGPIYGIIAAGTRDIIQGNFVKRLRTDSDLKAIVCSNANDRVQIINNSVYDLSTSGAAVSSYGIYTASDYSIVTSNKVEQVKNSTTAANAFGLYAGGTSAKINANYCYNNGADTGIENNNGNNFSDAGTTTQVTNNSWQLTSGQAFVISGTTYEMGKWYAYTPTFTGFGTPTNVSFSWKREGGSLKVMGKFTTGTNTAVEARISLPLSLVSDSTLIPSIMGCGDWIYGVANAATYYCLIESGVGYITVGAQTGAITAINKLNGTAFQNNSVQSLFNIEIPVNGWN